MTESERRTPEEKGDLAQTPPSDSFTLRHLIENHSEFVWRSLRRLGVPESVAPDAMQQVYLAATQRLGDIRTGREKAFLFGVVINVAAHVRRNFARRREDPASDSRQLIDPSPSPDELLDQVRARQILDEVLDSMAMELRTVFVLYELEEITVPEIAELLELPSGTVSSRLRRAREQFEKAVHRLRARSGMLDGGLR